MAAQITIKKAKPSNKPVILPKNPPFIDKLTVVLTPQNEKDAHDTYMGLFQSLNDTEVWTDGPKGGGYNLGKRIKLPSLIKSKHWPLLQVKHRKDQKLVKSMRLEFVPVDLKPQGVIELHSVLMTIMEGGWETIAKHGHVSRIDVSVDIPGVQMDAFQFLPKHPATTLRWTLNGNLQNVVYGKPTGNQTLIYDRKTKRLAQNQEWDGQSVLRIERRLKNVGLKVHELPALPNPFVSIQLTQSMPPPPAGVDENFWIMFCDSVKVRGLKDALLLLKKTKRTAFRNHMEAHVLPWWQPEEIWKGWKPMLSSHKIADTKWPG